MAPHTDPTRKLLAVIGLACIAFLGVAWWAQYGPDRQQPCPLCILQRYAYLLLADLALLGAAIPRRAVRFGCTLGAAAVALAGLGLAGWQVAKGDTMLSCQRDPIGVFVNGLPMADWWPQFFFATGGCADKLPSIMGFTVPIWSLVWFTVFSVVLVALVLAHLRNKWAP